MSSHIPSSKLVPLALAVALTALLPALAPKDAVAGRSSNSSTANRPGEDRSTALVQLNGDPLSTDTKTRPTKDKKVDFNSTAVKSYRAQLAALRNNYKTWLRVNVPGAKVTSEFDLALNAVTVELNGATLAQVSATSMVRKAEYEGLYYKNADPDLDLISAPAAWAQGGGSRTAGAGIKVAIIDSGIDATHPCFSDAGYAPQQQLGDRRFTNNKLIVAKVFSPRGPQQQKFTAEAIDNHGTHVGGTVACNYGIPANVKGAPIPNPISGVAPRALLGNYNVFPGNTESVSSGQVVKALEAAYEDGFDIANMSLSFAGCGGDMGHLSNAVNNIDQANMVVAVAAGNDGPGPCTVGAPGSAARALTAGASYAPHFVGAPVTVNGVTYHASSGEFATVSSNLTAPLGVPLDSGGALSTVCTALGASYSGQIVLASLVDVGCGISTRVRNAQNAGAAAVLLAEFFAGDPFSFYMDGTPNQPTIPVYLLSREAGQALKTQPGASTIIGAAQSYVITSNADIMGFFSSQGPTYDFRIKPDVVAPGVHILSAMPPAFCAVPPCFAFLEGTSFASPHLAGSAAVVLQQHPMWSAAMVRSAIVNTADRGVLRDHQAGLLEDNVNINGAGRENLLKAVKAQVTLDPVSVSFGAGAAGKGRSLRTAVTLTNTTGGALTYTLGLSGTSAAMFSVSPSSVTIAAGSSANVTVTMNGSNDIAPGSKQAYLEIGTGQNNIAHAAVFTFVQ